MATKLTVSNASSWNQATEFTGVTLTAGTEYYFEAPDKGDKYVLLAENGSTAGTLTILAGDSFMATNDLTLTIAANKSYHVEIESALFKQVKVGSSYKGGIVIKATTSSSIKVAVVKLP